MHIAFAGGGVSRIKLAQNLLQERSNSLSGSVNYDKSSEHFIAGFTLEGFYTGLKDVFYLQPAGSDAFGDIFEKRNGTGAMVAGTTLELRANYDRKVQAEAGITLQRSSFEVAVENIPGLNPLKQFLRTPDTYGYMTLTFNPGPKFSASVSGVYTGPMTIAHFAGAPGVTSDSYFTTPSFTEINIRAGYTFVSETLGSGFEIFGGIKNLFNSFQDDFDSGKYRDSNYIYGPSAPITFSVGIKLKSL
jgi:outer membrane receptor for ferrienterochelin and colicins